MTARLLDGTALAATIRSELQPRVAAFTARTGRPPGLGIVLVGDNPASEIYVRAKARLADQTGLRVELLRLSSTANLDEVLATVHRLNRSTIYDGILVQAPLPDTLGRAGAQRVFDAIDPEKDVDGFHPVNVGRLVQNRAVLVPCTPAGIIQLLERSGIAISGSRAVVIGRSDIVGKPMALLLMHRHATVTVCHSRTVEPERVAATADILVSAIGRPSFVTGAFIKPGATVIDVGINRITDEMVVRSLYDESSPRRAEFAKRGSLLVGDVHPEVAEIATALTPVPGGVGPLTIAMLLGNTVTAAETRATRGGEAPSEL